MRRFGDSPGVVVAVVDSCVLTWRDLRALVALAEEAEALKAALARIRDGAHKTWESPRDLAAEALAPPRTKPPKPARCDVDSLPPIGSVGLDKRGECPVCGRRVAVTKRGLYAPHAVPKPARRRSMFTPEQERIIRECEAGDEMPAPKPARGKQRRK